MKKTVGIILGLGLVSSIHAGVVFHNSIADNPNTGTGDPYQYEVGRWSSSATSKTYDLDGDNIYGTDGYFIANTADTGGNFAWDNNSHESAPSYTGGISPNASPSVGVMNSGSHGNAEAILQESGTGVYNLGYTGIFNNSGGAASAVPHQLLFSYIMNRDMEVDETIRVGIMSGSLPDGRVGLSSLDLRVGTDIAAATLVDNPSNGKIDMYFFDLTDLSDGDTIEIYGGKTADGTPNNNFQWATISAVTFDSIPEPATLGLVAAFGGAVLFIRRRLML